MENVDLEKNNIENTNKQENIIKDNNIKKSDYFNIIWIILLLTLFTWWVWFIWLVIFYVLKKEDMNSEEIQFIKNIINFNLSFTIYLIVSFILTFILIWFLGLIVFGLAYYIFSIIGIIKAFNQEVYKFPWTINFIK